MDKLLNWKSEQGQLPDSVKNGRKTSTAMDNSQKRKKRKRQRPPTPEPGSDEEKIEDCTYNKKLYGVPMEDVDPTLVNDTFCVITKKFNKHYVYRYTADKSLYIFSPLHPLRKLAIKITSHRYFDTLIIFTILCNCATLALSVNEFDEYGHRVKEQFDPETDSLEYFFLAIYFSEMCLKIIARGFALNKFSYIRNAWNIMDFIVVCSGLITTAQVLLTNKGEEHTQMGVMMEESSSSSLQLLRIFRVLRAVKTVSVLPGLKTMINALLSSAVQLLEVMALNFFCLLIFSLFALQLFMGKLRQKCVLIQNGVADVGTSARPTSTGNPDKDWYNWVNTPSHWKDRDPAYPKLEPQNCGNGSEMRECSEGFVCLNVAENPDDGWTSFDHIFLSMLSTFQLLATDFWERPYELVLSSSGPWCIFFFLVVLFLGSFYLLNLMLAVVALSYETEVAKKKSGPLTKTEKLHLNRASSVFSFEAPYRLALNTLPSYRRKTQEDKEALAKRSVASFRTLDDTGVKPKSLGEAILGLLGRRLTLDASHILEPSAHFGVEEPKAKQESRHDITVVDVDVEARPQPTPTRRKSYFRSIDGDSSETEVASVCGIYDGHYGFEASNHTYPRRRRNLEKCTRQFALVLRKKLLPLVNHPMFDAFITVCICVNTVFFAMEHHGQTEELKEILEIGNNVFLLVFTVECALKLLALQKEYYASRWNLFDFFLVIVSMLDTILEDFLELNFVRSMRLLRIFKLAQSWITMKVLLKIIFSTFGALGNLTLLLLIVIYIFAILGMQVIGGNYTPQAFNAVANKGSFPRWNFQNFGYAFMMVFRVICGEWIESLWECLEVHKEEEYLCFLIFFPTLIFGNFIVLNLFLALLLDSFNTADLKAAQNQEIEASGKAQNLKKIVVLLLMKREDEEKYKNEHREEKMMPEEMKVSSTEKLQPTTSVQNIHSKKPSGDGPPLESLARIRFKVAAKKVMIKNRVAVAERRIEEAEQAIARRAALAVKGNGKRRESFGFAHDVTPSMSLDSDLKAMGNCVPIKCMEINCFVCNKIRMSEWTKWNRIRGRAGKIVGHRAFEWTILLFIFLSSIALCFEDVNLEKKPLLKEVLFILNIIFCIIFVFEMLLKWFAFGVWSYFKNSWCILDFFIVVVSVVTLYFDISLRLEGRPKAGRGRSNFAALKALRTIRALRPLRAISRWEGMKIVINALMYAIPLIFNVFLVCLLFWLIFSIMGVQLYKGKFYKCVTNEGDLVDYQIAPTKSVCCALSSTHSYSWINTFPNFDNVPQGYLSLFQIATFEGWIELMAAAIDAVDVDQQPIRENSPVQYLFFVVFIVFGGFFTLNLFIGVMVDNFSMLKKKYEGNLIEIFLTPSQRNYYTALKKLGQKKPRKIINKPENKFLMIFYELAICRRFEVIVFIMIFLNLLVLSVEHFDQSLLHTEVIVALNSIFTTIYLMEAVIKIMGLRQYYFTFAWNLFDFVLAMASVVDLFAINIYFDFPIPPSMLRALRVFRIGRVLRNVKAARGIRKLMYALVVSIPALGNIFLTVALITFIYTILGMAIFSGTAKYGAVDQLFNWDTFMNSCIVLLRLMLAAGWNDILDGVVTAEVTCGPFRKLKCGLDGEPECPIAGVAIAYFVSYIVIVFLIIINMYTAIILENYVEASQEEELGIVEDDLEMFYTRWSRYDPQATQFIGFEQLSEFLNGLDPPFCVKKPNIVAIVAFNLPICRGNKIHCLDILHALVKRVLGQVDDGEEFQKLKEQMERKFSKQFPTRKLLDIISSTRIWKIQQNAAVVIQREWRAYYKRTHPQPQQSLQQ